MQYKNRRYAENVYRNFLDNKVSLGKKLRILTILRTYPVLLKLEVLLQGHVEPSVPR